MPQTMMDNRIWRSSVSDAQLSYAEYFTSNLLNPVFFEKVTQSIPENAIMLEIAPDGILQDVMKEFSDINIALLQRNHKDNVKIFLQGLGKMYNAGAQPQLANLYPTIQFPVSRGTPMISPSIKYIRHLAKYVKAHKNITQFLYGRIFYNFLGGIIPRIGTSHLSRCKNRSLLAKD
jgi:fatty acid synthase